MTFLKIRFNEPGSGLHPRMQRVGKLWGSLLFRESTSHDQSGPGGQETLSSLEASNHLLLREEMKSYWQCEMGNRE